MRLILQRVRSAAVRVGSETVGEIGLGGLILAGVEQGDGEAEVVAAADKVAGLRFFDDDRGRMNRAAADVGAGFLVVSQFTLAASLDRGRRPSFDAAAPSAVAAPLIERLVAELRDRGLPVASGRFGARMAVELVNDGPVTFVIDVPPAGGSPPAPPSERGGGV